MLAQYRRAAGVSLAVGFALLLTAGPGQAAKTPNAFCTAAKSVAANIVNSTAIGSEGEPPSQLKAYYLKIEAAKPALLRTAPGPVRAELAPVLAYIGAVVTDLQEAGWDVDMLAPVQADLNARAAKVKPQLKGLKSYFHGACNLHV